MGTANVLVAEESLRQDSFTLSSYLHKMREALQNYDGEDMSVRKYYPMDQIAKKLHLTCDMLRKKIYQTKPLSRDWLIAICAAHGLSADETDTALTGCNMPRFDCSILREDLIYEKLNENDNLYDENCKNRRSIGIDEINNMLIDNNETVLIREKGKESVNKGFYPYKILGNVIRTYTDEGDQYDSLSTAYDLRFSYAAYMLLELPDKRKCELGSDSTKLHTIRYDDDEFATEISSEEMNEYRDYYLRLDNQVKQKLEFGYACLNDTKNYKNRISANMEGDSICIFYEEFNYSMPERQEYFLMEYADGTYKMTVSHQSMFMKKYLGIEKYKKIYRSITKDKTYTFTEEQLEKISTSSNIDYYRRNLASFRKKVFAKMKAEVENCLLDLRDRKQFVNNLECIMDGNDVACEFFKVENEYKCIKDDFDNLLPTADSAVFAYGEEKIEITLTELYRAYELGFTSIDQILRVKNSTGTIESVLG